MPVGDVTNTDHHAEQRCWSSRHEHISTDLDTAIHGADFVFSAIRVGGLDGRVVDERVALDEGVIGICDSPVGLGRRVAKALGVDPASARFDYAGLNHLGWLRGVYVDGRDQLPRLMSDEGALSSFDEGRLFGADWLRTLGTVPNEYPHYYYFTRQTLAAARAATYTRGAFLREQQHGFYARVSADPGPPFAVWDGARLEVPCQVDADGPRPLTAGPIPSPRPSSPCLTAAARQDR